MAESDALSRKLYALLIGIDCYLPNKLPDGGYYPSLGGCVRDINHVENFLRSRLNLPDKQIIKLTATNGSGKKPVEPEELWPTYKNIVEAFQKVTKLAKAGEQLYIHYSGHGGRSTTSFPKLKGEKGLDESLVPTDIGNSEARYVRDIEIAYLLKQMTDKGIIPTVVFDSCHSGGATRGGDPGVAVRGIPSIDTTERPTDSLVATQEELERVWQQISPAASRNAKLASGWIPDLKEGVLLAACRADELANEYAFEGSERNGALTYWLLDSLKQVGPGLNFHMLHDRILAKVHAKFPQQTPQLQGDGSRVVFETNRVVRPPSARVLEVDAAGQRVRIDAGQAQGIGKGASFALYAAATTEFTEEARLALAEATEVQATETWASLVEGGNVSQIVEGAQAVLLDAGDVRFEGRIRLVKRDDLPADIKQDKALKKLEDEIKTRKWIRLAEEKEAADYQVAINFNNAYEVWEPSGRIVNNLNPELKIDDTQAATMVADRLVHLTKFNNVKLIENSASTSPLARQIELVVDKETGEKGPGGAIIVDDGEPLTFLVRNTSKQPLNVTVFDLQPDWSITKLFPPDAESQLIDPGASEPVALEFELPKDYKESLETIKVFATVGNTSFDWLQLPPLDEKPADAQRGTRDAANPLEKLMADFSADAPPANRTRARLTSVSMAKWTTAQADVLVRRRPATIKHVRDASTSLLQSAFEEVAERERLATRSKGEGPTTRASISDTTWARAITSYLADPEAAEGEIPQAPPTKAERGAIDTIKYCAGLAAKMAKEYWNAKIHGDDEKYKAYKAALTERFGDCDPRFAEAAAQYLEFLLKRGKVPYRRWEKLSDFVIEGKLPANATIGLVADWATGQEQALEVLRQVKQQKPQVVAHLGDIYYAGTESEVENYFSQPWEKILEPKASGITSLVLPGNHDLYSGGKPFYGLVDKYGQGASYFCLRNNDWQLIGLDTALNDKLGPTAPPTSLDPKEVEWLRDKIENSGNRRTVLLSHHQLFSTNDQFGDEKLSYNPLLYQQLESLLPKVDLWLWGHEHDLVIFEDYMGLKRARCIGGSAFPVGKYEMPEAPKNADVPYNKQVVLSKGAAFYQHCYAIMRLNGRSATVDYYEDSAGGRRLFSESL